MVISFLQKKTTIIFKFLHQNNISTIGKKSNIFKQVTKIIQEGLLPESTDIKR